MVIELCSTPAMPGKRDGSPSPLPGKGDGPLTLMPGKGGGPPQMPRQGGGPPPPPPNKGLGSNNAKKATTRLKRSPNMGNLLQQLRRKMEGSSLAEKSSQGRKKGAGSNGGQSMADALAELMKRYAHICMYFVANIIMSALEFCITKVYNRSSHYKQIEEDVKNHGKSIKEMQAALISFQTKDMDTLLKFYHQMEFMLDVLTDESQVLILFYCFCLLNTRINLT